MLADWTLFIKPLLYLAFGLVPVFLLGSFSLLVGKRRKAKTRIPIRENLPRPAGYSLQIKIQELDETLTIHAVSLIVVGAYVGYIFIETEMLAAAIVIGLIYVSYFFLGGVRTAKKLGNYRLGLLGEQAVGACLTELIADDCKVFHDLVIEEGKQRTWNIDHVVVSSKGVFCIETKCRRKVLGTGSKDKTKGWQVMFDGHTIEYPFGSDRFGLEQAERNAKWLETFIRESAAEKVQVEPVLVLPGWFVHRKARGKVRVVNEKELPQVVCKGPDILDEAQRQRIAYQIKQKGYMEIKN